MTPTFIRLSKWLVSRKMLVRYLGALLTLATLTVLFYVVENFRGARAWKRATEELAASGISLNLSDHLIPSVPDEENFCGIPLLRDLTVVIDGDTEKGEPGAKRRRLQAIAIVKQIENGPRFPGSGGHPSVTGKPTDLAKFRAYFEATGLFKMPNTGNPAADILAGMQVYEPGFVELTQALDRPQAVFVPGLGERLRSAESLQSLSTPHYTTIQNVLATLKLRAIAASQNSDPETAVQNLRIMARLTEAIAKETRLIGWLVQATAVAVMERGVWELLYSQTATDGQLQALETELSKILPRDSFVSSMNLELIMASDYLELAKTTSLVKLANLPPNVDVPDPIQPKLYPDGWWDQNKLSYSHRARQALELILNNDFSRVIDTTPIVPDPSSPYSMMTLPAMDYTAQILRLYIEETMLLQMQTACALERYHIAHGEYPESLASLASPPLDPIDRQPMRYRRSADGRYILYSIGYDQTDNGGTIHPKGRMLPRSSIGPGADDVTGYDWVWRYSAE